MPEPDLFTIFTRPLNETGLKYMVTGAAASIVYGEPRLTHDLDLVVEIKREDAEKMRVAFPPNHFYCPPIEVITIEAARPLRGHFNIIHTETGFKADIYVAGEDKLHQWAFERRMRISIAGETLWLAPAEYVILRKLEYYREGKSEKHLRDIAGMLEVSPGEIDFVLLEEKVKEYGLENEWELVRRTR
jgi:hypothetical protein